MTFTWRTDPAATLRKGDQYDDAVAAVVRGQRTRAGRDNPVQEVCTVPLVFGVLGSVEFADICTHLAPFRLRNPGKVLAAGVRAAVAAASTMIDARKAALAEQTAERRQVRRRRPITEPGSRRQRRAGRSGATQ